MPSFVLFLKFQPATSHRSPHNSNQHSQRTPPTACFSSSTPRRTIISLHRRPRNGIFVCQGGVTPSDDGKAVNYSGKRNVGTLCFVPGTSFGTDDWHEVVSASGQATLACHYPWELKGKCV